MMSLRSTIGSISAFFYRSFVGRIPFHCVRNLYLHWYLGAYAKGASVQTGCNFLNGRKVHLGVGTVINFGCLLDGRTYEITTGENVSIGPEASILTLGHDPQSPDFADRGGAVVIGNRVWIGYRAMILPGVKIGEGAVVGASAVVTRNVAAGTTVAGCPARPLAAKRI